MSVFSKLFEVINGLGAPTEKEIDRRFKAFGRNTPISERAKQISRGK